MIIFFYGKDTFRSRRKLSEIKEKYRKEIDLSGHSVVTLSGESLDAKKASEAISPSSLFVKKMMVIIENVFANKQQTFFPWLIEFLKKVESEGSDNIIVFLDEESGNEKGFPKYKKELWDYLFKQQFVQEFLPLPATRLASWVREEVESRGGKISNVAASAMVGLVGDDLWQLDNEINKMIGYKAISGDKMIEAHEVEQLVKGNFDDNIFALTDAISNRQKATAVRLLDEQISGGAAPHYLLSMVTRQFRIMLQVREALDAGMTSRQVASGLKLHPFVAQKTITQVRNFSAIYLRRAYSHLSNIDFMSKTGQGDLRTMLDLMIVKM